MITILHSTDRKKQIQYTFSFFLAFSLLLFTNFSAFATHIVGGELEFVHVRGDTYRVGMVKYFDAINGNPGAIGTTAIIGIFSKKDN